MTNPTPAGELLPLGAGSAIRLPEYLFYSQAAGIHKALGREPSVRRNECRTSNIVAHTPKQSAGGLFHPARCPAVQTSSNLLPLLQAEFAQPGTEDLESVMDVENVLRPVIAIPSLMDQDLLRQEANRVRH